MVLFSKKNRAKSYEVIGKQLECLVCQHDKFTARQAQLNTSTATFFGLDWANTTAQCLCCDECGYIHWS